MRRLLGAGLVLAALAGPAPADAAPARHVKVGIGENAPELFSDSRFLSTGIRHVRLTVPFNVVRAGGIQLNAADDWLRQARDLGLEPLVTFGESARRRRYLPTVRQYRMRVREFRHRYPWVHLFSTWNEANLAAIQPTGRNPRRTARFYRALRRQCAGGRCRVLAADLLAGSWWQLWRWVRAFRRRAGRGPHIWGLHNYPDANRGRLGTTARFLRTLPRDKVWFTETGGVVRFRKRWPYNERRAARAIRHAFRLTRLSRRVRRIYIYSWRGSPRRRRWDSGLMRLNGTPRRGYFAFLHALSRPRFRPR
jgi:hypothetical protein